MTEPSLRERRQQLGWSQARLAQEAGVTENTVADAERGLRATRPSKLAAILAALGEPPPAAPPGYGFTGLWACDRCGATVADTDVHDAWHARVVEAEPLCVIGPVLRGDEGRRQ